MKFDVFNTDTKIVTALTITVFNLSLVFRTKFSHARDRTAIQQRLINQESQN
jgi:hypothetical protein